MDDVSIKENTLCIGNKIVHTFDFKIKEFLQIDNKIVVLLRNPGVIIYNETIFCFNTQGNFLWQVENKSASEPHCPFTGIVFNNDKLKGYKQCGFQCEIDVETGKILLQRFMK